MIWLILILAIPGIAFVTWLTIIETARDHLSSWPATILVFVILLILIVGLSFLIWCLCTTVALDNNAEVEPQEFIETFKVKDQILIVEEPAGTTYIVYHNDAAFSTTKIDAHKATVKVYPSPNSYSYVEVYTATWVSPIRRFLYGKSVPGKYYIVYTTGD